MKFINRNGILYVSINGIRKSTKLSYSQKNIKKFKSFYEDDEFFNKFNVKKIVPTVVELCEQLLEEKEKELKRNSYASYLSLLHCRIVPYFGNKYVTEIKPLDVYEWYKTFNDLSTLATCDAILKPTFERAIIKGYIQTTPFILKRPKLKSNYKINPFSFEEANIIILNATDRLRNLFGVSFYTGMRTGEVLGLKWSCVDFINYTITINNQRTLGQDDTPKTISSNRVIDMLPQCEKFLHEQNKITGSNDYVFLNKKNKPYNSSISLQADWKLLLFELDIPYRSIYQTRHSFASNMLSNGENDLWVSQMLGHKSLNVTLAKYSKYIKRIGIRKSTFLDK